MNALEKYNKNQVNGFRAVTDSDSYALKKEVEIPGDPEHMLCVTFLWEKLSSGARPLIYLVRYKAKGRVREYMPFDDTVRILFTLETEKRRTIKKLAEYVALYSDADLLRLAYNNIKSMQG